MRTTRQDDFSAGTVDAERAGIPSNAVLEARNVIPDGEAALRRRGSTRAYGSDRSDLVWVWHGVLAAGRRTVGWDTTAGFCVLADDSDGFPGSTVSSTAYDSTFHGHTPSLTTEPPAHAVLGGILFVAPQIMYAGSRKAASYSPTSTVFTQGSTTVTRAAGGFTANVDAGMLVMAPSGSRYYVVSSVDSDTSLTLAEAFLESSVTNTASFKPVASFRDVVSSGAGSLPSFDAVAVVANRLVIVPNLGLWPGQILFSDGLDPDTGVARWYSFSPTTGNRHPPPSGEVRALADLRDRLFVFTTDGVHVISNMAYEIVDSSGNPQHRVELYTRDVRALTQASITSWRNALIVPGFDDVVLLDGVSPPVPVSQGVRRTWRSLVAVSKPGQAVVFGNFLALPIQGEVWLFKLDAPTPDDDGPIFPMVKWNGGAIQGTVALTLRPVEASNLPGGARVLAANASLTGVFDMLPCFLGEPGALSAGFSVQKADHSAATVGQDSYLSLILTRDFALGDAREGLLRRVQAWYTLDGLESTGYWDDTGIAATFPDDGLALICTAGGSRDTTVSLTGVAAGAGGESEGRSPKGWDVRLQAERARLILALGVDCTEFTLHGIQLTFRESNRAY